MSENTDTAGLPHASVEIVIYGVPLEALHDQSLGPILEGQRGYPFIGILYCGYKAGNNEIRLATDRLFYFKAADSIEESKIDGFTLEGHAVRGYRLSVSAEIYEKTFRRVNIAAELSRSQILASLVATPPGGGADFSRLETMTRKQLQELADQAISGSPRKMDPPFIVEMPTHLGEGGFGGGSGCNTWYQSYKETRYDPWSRSDPAGADCD